MKEHNLFVTSSLMGGLGNQMFQISHALCQGWKNNVPSLFKPEAYTPMQANQPTKYTDNIFRNINFINFNSETKRVHSPWVYTELNFNLDKPIEFHGYFQSSKNFLGYDNEIKKIFSPTDEFLMGIERKYPEIKLDKTISLHIRRGDYLTISSMLPTIDISYIEKCLYEIGDYDKLFIFSDDKDWVKENVNFKKTILVEGLEDYEELWMISLCKTNIMSNSTFSWWGSYLNTILDKVVFVPSVWFGPQGEKDYEDLYESDWNKINVEYENGKLVCY